MTIQQLEYFMKTAELLNLTRVSEALHVSQPTVSYAIRELEKQFGITLFKRSSSGLKLTPEGILFMEKAKQLLQHFNSFENSFLNLGTEQLTVRLGVISLYASILPVVYRYGEEHDFSCNFILDSRKRLEDSFHSELLDLVVTDYPCPYSDARSVKFGEKKMVLCVHPDLFFSEKKTVIMEDVTCPMVNYEDLLTLIPDENGNLQAASVVPKIILTTSQIATTINFVVNKTAGTVMPGLFFTGTDIRTYTIADYPPRPLYLWMSKEIHTFDELARHIIDHKEAILRNQPDWPEVTPYTA